MKNVLRWGVWVVVLAGLAERECSAAITWNITYADTGSGFGFDDPTQGATRRNTITAVTNYLNTVIDANGVIDLVIRSFGQLPSSGTLASAGPLFFTSTERISERTVFRACHNWG